MSLRVQMNNMFYPIDRMQFNFKDYNIVEPYISYANCSQIFGNEAQLNPQEFHDLYPIFCFNTSAHPRALLANGIDITLHIEKSSTLTLQAFALVLEDSHYTIDVDQGRMLRIQ